MTPIYLCPAGNSGNALVIYCRIGLSDSWLAKLVAGWGAVRSLITLSTSFWTSPGKLAVSYCQYIILYHIVHLQWEGESDMSIEFPEDHQHTRAVAQRLPVQPKMPWQMMGIIYWSGDLVQPETKTNNTPLVFIEKANQTKTKSHNVTLWQIVKSCRDCNKAYN